MGVAVRKDSRLVFNNAGVLFFGREPTRFLRHAVVDCLLFQGTKKLDVLDRKELKGNLMENVKQAMIFLQQHLSLRYEIKGLHRKEILEIPKDVLREAVLNAVMHRDHHFDTANISVEIYRDRVEISDPGELPPGMKPEDLGKKSVRRNKLIADLFHRIGEVEKIGSGIDRMKEMVAASGLNEPRFEFTSFFTIIFDRKPQVTPQVRKVLEACNEPKSREEIQRILDLSDRWHLRKTYIQPALKKGWLVMTIPNKPRSSKQKYVLTEKGRKMMMGAGHEF
jgi:ATP-dependent DNA helicase RecG